LRNLDQIIKREVLKALLRAKTDEELSLSMLSREIGIPRDVVEEALSSLKNLVNLEDGKVRIGEDDRIRIAVLCLSLGADVSYVARYLDWREFERFTASILEAYGYTVYRGFRFKSMGRRWEIDILALKKPIVLCLNCKHHLRQNWSILRKAALEELSRAEAFKQALKRLKLDPKPSKGWWILPVLVTLFKPRSRIYEGVPIVQITELRNFLEELALYKSFFKTLNL